MYYIINNYGYVKSKLSGVLFLLSIFKLYIFKVKTNVLIVLPKVNEGLNSYLNTTLSG